MFLIGYIISIVEIITWHFPFFFIQSHLVNSTKLSANHILMEIQCSYVGPQSFPREDNSDITNNKRPTVLNGHLRDCTQTSCQRDPFLHTKPSIITLIIKTNKGKGKLHYKPLMLLQSMCYILIHKITHNFKTFINLVSLIWTKKLYLLSDFSSFLNR